MASVTRTTIWSDNQVLTAAALNGEFNNLLNSLNIVNADISAGAAISPSKITFGGTNGQYLTSNGSGGLTYTTPPTTTLYRAFGLSSPGTQSVANNVSWNPVVPENMTCVKLWIAVAVAPVGSSLTVRIFTSNNSTTIATVSVTAGNFTANTTSFNSSALSAGDILQMDITAVGSSTPGSGVSAVLECTQP